jgi:hypothetical protein
MKSIIQTVEKKNKKSKRIMNMLFIPMLRLALLGLIATISVILAEKISIMKLDYFTGGFMYVTHSQVWMDEYSLTLGFLSILFFFLIKQGSLLIINYLGRVFYENQ